MSQYNDTGYGTIVLQQDTPKYLRVTADGQISGDGETGPTGQNIGVTMAAGRAGETVGIAFANKQGTVEGVASTPIAAGAPVFAGLDGRFSGSGTVLRGYSKTSAGSPGDIFELFPIL